MSEIKAIISRRHILEDLMRGHEVTAWPDTVHRARVEGGDKREVLEQRVLDMYRGPMGSLTDLIISRSNGDKVDDEAAANARLDRLSERAQTRLRICAGVRHELWDLARTV